MLSIDEIWQEATTALQNKLSAPGYKTFLSSVNPVSFVEGILTISVPNEYTKNWIRERCEHVISSHLKDIAGNVLINYEIQLAEASPVELASTPATSPSASSVQSNKNSNLNPKYTFERFVVGHNNRFAHAASLAVSKSPANAYNPLFIYGGIGLGKTHLLHAIGNKVIENFPESKVMYVSSEKFTNALINAIRDGKNEQFRTLYRGIDVLLVDDIQFIAGKERTQEEFFHTFNALHEANKQIVISSDRSPKEITQLEDRLRSRFEWGLLSDIQAPDFETRLAILRKKAAADSINIPDEVLLFIATQIPSNVRELEGALISIVAYASLINTDLTVDLASDVIKDIITPKRDKPITIASIKRAVSEHYNVSVDDLSAKVRTKEKAHARQVAMYLVREMTSSSLPKIGENFGGRDHTTVMHACDKVKGALKSDEQFNDTLKIIERKILTSASQQD